MIYSIEEIKQIAIPIVSEYGIARLGIFGSYARGEANEDSDLDFIMDTDGLIGMIQYNAIIRKLEEEFGCHVDIITTGCSDREFLTRIQKEEILIYLNDARIPWPLQGHGWIALLGVLSFLFIILRFFFYFVFFGDFFRSWIFVQYTFFMDFW